MNESLHGPDTSLTRDESQALRMRRYLVEGLAAERSRAERLGTVFSVCLVDVDHFKAINDELGHSAGDAVLKELPALAAAGLRGIDIFGRFGGEEFLMILPGTLLEGARADRALYAGKAIGRNRVVLG